MQNIYLVCTRAALSASALTYIINQSPEFYNLAHDNLWSEENSDDFGKAYIINDWWNIPPEFKNIYNFQFRNTNALTKDQLLDVVEFWDKFETDKGICLFTHATNIKEIVELRNKYSLPITVVTTTFGDNFYKFADLFLKREYNTNMNDFEDMFSTWKYIYENMLFKDLTWSEHADIVLEVADYLDNKDVYSLLRTESNKNIKMWVDDYLRKNAHEELDLKRLNSINRIKIMCYILATYHHIVEDINSKILFAFALYEIVRKLDDPTTIDNIIKRVEEHARMSLT